MHLRDNISKKEKANEMLVFFREIDQNGWVIGKGVVIVNG
jgi:hypothetical protein